MANNKTAKRSAQAPCPAGLHHPHAAAQPDTAEHSGVFCSCKPPEPGAAPRALHGASVRPTDLSRGNRASSPLWKSVLFSSLARMSILFISISSMSLIRRSTPRDSSAPITAGTQRASETRSRAGCCHVGPRKSPSPRLQPQRCPGVLRSPAPLRGSVVYGPSRCPAVPDIPSLALATDPQPHHPAQARVNPCLRPNPAGLLQLPIASGYTSPGSSFLTCLSRHKLLTYPPDPACPEHLRETNFILKH